MSELTFFIAKDGRGLTSSEAEKLLTDPSYKIIRQQELPKSRLFVSTVWLGVDHNFGFNRGPPIIFETMVFKNKFELSDYAGRRYSTEEEALRGHEQLVAEWTARMPRISRRRKKRFRFAADDARRERSRFMRKAREAMALLPKARARILLVEENAPNPLLYN